MRRKPTTSILLAGAAAILTLALAGGLAVAKPQGDVRSFHGTVSNVAKDNRALTIDRNDGSRVRFVVRGTTAYEHISGLAGLAKGTPVEVHAFRANDRLIATRIEANPGGTSGHGADDPPGDDHGSGGHGSDDAA
jgi:Domain of unknown function (DUF5666)